MRSCSSQEPGWSFLPWVQSRQAKLCWTAEGGLLGLSGSLTNHCMCDSQFPVVMVSLSSTLPRQPFLWKSYCTIGKFSQRRLQVTLSKLLLKGRSEMRTHRSWFSLSLAHWLGKDKEHPLALIWRTAFHDSSEMTFHFSSPTLWQMMMSIRQHFYSGQQTLSTTLEATDFKMTQSYEEEPLFLWFQGFIWIRYSSSQQMT